MTFRVTRVGGTLASVLLLFFVSGFAALLYQIIWQRMLGFFSGVDVYSVTITVSAFMAGLGCGSLAGGHLADRLSPKRRLLAFGLAEAIITLFALCSKWIYYDLLFLKWSALAGSPGLLPMILFASLLVPTFCMGLTLPILAKALTATIETASSVVGYLYGVNTLGAAVGALVTPWLLLRHFAFPDVLRIGAALNATCALGAMVVWWLGSGRSPTPAPTVRLEARKPGEAGPFPPRVWMLIYALSGFIALSLEIVWFRLLGVLQKSTSLTFPSLLAVYLGGLALGVLIGVPLARRARRPAVIFLALQSGITLYAAVALALFVQHVDQRSFLEPLWTYLSGYEPANTADLLNAMPVWFSGGKVAQASTESARFVLLLYFVLPIALIGPSTFLMGMSFPVLQKLVQDNPVLLGRRVGWLQTVNIAGSMLGALLVGWCLLGWLGTAGTMKLLVVLGGVLLCLAAWRLPRRHWVRVIGIIISISLVGWSAAAVPASSELWAKLHGAPTRAIIAREGASGLAVLKGHPDGFDRDIVWVFNNGIGQSWLPYGAVHTQIGMFAVLLHPNPEEVGVIGLGSGDTVYALGGSPHTRQLTCIEIVEPAYHNLRELAGRLDYPALHALVADSRIKWLFTDGRAHLLHSAKLFDVIEADALRPTSAYSGNLYSWEYFHLLKTRLKPGGLAVTWAPTERVLASFLEAFSYVILVDDIAIGSEMPIAVETEAILRRLAHPFTTEHYGRIGVDLRPLLENLLAGRFALFSPERERPANKSDLNSDLFPRDEYMVPPLP